MGLPERIRLVLLFGGASAEHDVSCVTAAHVLAALDRDRYDVLPIGISREGTWVDATDAIAGLAPAASLAVVGPPVDGLPVVRAADAVPTVVLPLLHGPHGEDGTVQGLCELAGVAYVGSGVLASAVAMDKAMAKVALAAAGVPQCAWESAHRDDLDAETQDLIADRLGLPLFVKPANMGSSVGVSRVADRAELAGAVAEAARFDEWLVFEEAVDGRELECAVLGNRPARASVVGEIRPGADFYDYDDKYVDGAAELLIPAPLPDPIADGIRAMALEAYAALRCEGMARVDFFWEEHGRGLLVNEVNTIPGFTPISMYPKMWEATGLPYSALLDELVALALERHGRRSTLHRTR